MIKALLIGIGSLAFATAASAYTVTVDTAIPSDFTLFNAYVGESGTFNTTMGLFSGDGIVYAANQSVVNDHKAPPGDAAYMSVDGTETLSLAGNVSSFRLIWGSPDTDNNLGLSNISINGQSIANLASLTLGDGGALVTISDLDPFSQISFASAGAAFEFSLDPVPETSTWVMMGLGFAALGFVGYRKKDRLAVI